MKRRLAIPGHGGQFDRPPGNRLGGAHSPAVERCFDYHRGMAQALIPNGTVALRDAALALFADGLRFATVATVNADGSPHQVVIWYILEGDTVVLNGAEGRVWITNLQRDPRLSLSVEDGYRWMSVRGTIDRVDRGSIAQADAAISARHYHADEPQVAEDLIHGRFELQQRVSFRLSLAGSKLYYHED